MQFRNNKHPGHEGAPAGFTLTEILIVVAIIIALAALVIPISRSAIAKSRQGACLGNLRQIGIGLESYLQDHNDTMPVLEAGRKSKDGEAAVLEVLLAQYIETPDTFHCPADREKYAESGSSYLWNSTQNGQHKLSLKFFNVSDNPGLIPLVTDKEAWHPGKSGVNILYADYSAAKEFKMKTSP
jgi:type II secretory pathway pseudopilin PulG